MSRTGGRLSASCPAYVSSRRLCISRSSAHSISTAPAATMAMPVLLAIILLFFLHQYCPTENNKGKSGASQHLDRPVKLTGLDQVADVGGDAVIGLVCVVIRPDPADGALALIFIICFHIKNPVHCTIGKLIVQFNG